MSITADVPNDRVRLEPEARVIAKRLARQNERSLAAEIRYGYMRYLASLGYDLDQSDAPDDR